MSFLASLYGTKYMKSSTFAVISRTKVFTTLILHSLFHHEFINIRMIVFALVMFSGVTLVVDSTVFSVGTDTSGDPTQFMTDSEAENYYKEQALGLLFCFVYVIGNSLGKLMETIYSM